MRKFLLVLFLGMGVVITAFAQERTITGVVSDENAEPLPGVNVIVKSTTIGTITNLDGEYSIKVPEGYNELLYTFIGYTTITKEIGAERELSITMGEDLIGLEEVVVTALGVSRDKKSVGYSTQKVETTEILNSNEQNLITALSSKAAGVQVNSNSGAPGGSANIRIRGNSTITGNNSPLIVVDGVYMDNSYNNTDTGGGTAGVANSNRAIDINPNDIADINILKGIAATALYGTRAANGAIIITTKRGKQGAKGLNAEYRTSVGIEQVTSLPLLQQDYAQGSNGVYSAPATGASGSWGPLLSDLATLEGEDGSLQGFDANSNLVPVNSEDYVREIGTPINNMENFFQNGSNMEHYLGFSGASDKASFGISGSYSTRNGIVPLSNFDRITLRTVGDAQLTKEVKAFANFNYANTGGRRIQQGSNLSGVMLGLARTPPTFDNANGSDDPEDETAYLNPDGSQRNYRGGGGYDNPYWVINQNPFEDDVNRFYGNTGLSVDPLDWLNVTYRIGIDMYTDRRKQIFAIGARSFPSGRVVEDQFFRRNTTSDLIVSARRQVSDAIEVGLTLGHNYDIRNFQNVFTTGDELTIPNFYNLSNSALNATESGETTTERRIRGIYGQVEFNYNKFVYLQGTLRQDKASTFGEAQNTFWYPSASVGFVFTDAFDLTDSPIFSFGKLRASYGQVGIEPVVYNTRNIFTSTSYGGGYLGVIGFPWIGEPGFTVSNRLRNSDLKPEIQTEWEIGADLRLFRGKLRADVAYYDRTTEGAIFPVPVSPASGFAESYQNAGTISNKGWEVILGFSPIKNKNFTWDTQVTYTRNKNVVESLAEGVDGIFLAGFVATQSRAVAGESFGALFGGRWLRDENGDKIIENDPNKASYGFPIVDPERGVIGDPNPDFLVDIRNTFDFKGLNFSFLINRRQGGDIWNGTMGALSFFGAHERTLDRGSVIAFDGVKGTITGIDEEGAATFETAGENNIVVTNSQAWYQGNGGGFGSVDETYVQDASWWRLREVSLGFNLPTKWLGKSPFSGAGVTLIGRNLWLNTPYTGVDPETNLTGGSNNGFGLDYFNMPNTKSYVASLSLKF